jgi:transcription elongation GreA/GreB family factor
MLSVEKIEKIILRVAGDPDSGSIKTLAKPIAEAIVKAEGGDRVNPPHQQGKEKRVVRSPEVR